MLILIIASPLFLTWTLLSYQYIYTKNTFLSSLTSPSDFLPWILAFQEFSANFFFVKHSPYSLLLNCLATCPLAGVWKGLSNGPRVHLPLKENVWSRHQRLFEENVRKTKMEKAEGLRVLKMRIRKLFTQEEGINTPTHPSQGKAASNRVWKLWLQNYLFSFLSLFSLFLFFTFCLFYKLIEEIQFV